MRPLTTAGYGSASTRIHGATLAKPIRLECVREATSLDEKGLLADSAARLIAALVEVS